MKLLYCVSCEDVFKLDRDLRSCKCGAVKGKYLNNVEAVTNGRGFSLAIGNGSLQQAIIDMKVFHEVTKGKAERDEYYETGQGRISHAWVRPNEGLGNPHAIIDDNL